jgi:hypothetical protein
MIKYDRKPYPVNFFTIASEFTGLILDPPTAQLLAASSFQGQRTGSHDYSADSLAIG